MKLFKLHSILSFYILIGVIVFFYIDKAVYYQINTHIYFVIVFVMIEIFFSFKVINKLFYNYYIAYSDLITQFTILIIMIYALEFSTTYQILIILITILLVYSLNKMHKRMFIQTRTKKYYHLKIRNNLLLTVIYIGYGVFCYFAFIITHPDFKTLLNQIDNAIYYVIYPYLIVILILFRLQYDNITDIYNTKQKYIKDRKKLILKRNLLINGLSLLLFFLKITNIG